MGQQFYFIGIYFKRSKMLQVAILFALPIISFCQDLPTICLQKGACYQGSWMDSLNSKYASFQGVRFAQPPIGNLRFKSPEPYIAQEGLHDVSQESNITCPN